MKACAFFGHRDYNYEEYRAALKSSIVDLIENHAVTQFYSGGRGNFDEFASRMVYELKKQYPHIRNTLVLSYIPKEKEEDGLPEKYDDSIYLLEKKVPYRYAIAKTNEKIVERADFIISGVQFSRGGAYQACEYALKKGKTIIRLL